ncbi:DUF6054 family protein [Paenibacillus sp. PastH-2]|uniref:DUF6054 family protein n=2 Tax=Paenibacillus TaxID=44249 RepID=UPI002474ABD4|nr:DUF6054 family protein [Paenibacillus sp. PastH-2]
MALIKDGMGPDAELLHEELNNLGDGRMIGTLVYERYYFRSGNQAAMVIIADNLQGICNIRLIPAGSSNSMILKVDWGAGKSFAASVAKLLSDYTVE